jgi:hypothetical protein
VPLRRGHSSRAYILIALYQVTAYHILISPSSFLQPSILILILDARKICSGATGQDSGCVKPDLYYKKMFHQLLVKLLDQEHKLNV